MPGPYIDYFRRIANQGSHLPATIKKCRLEPPLSVQVRPGPDRGSYSKCFLSTLRRSFAERFTTALRGERRPCVSCGFCEEVCPAGIMPAP